MREIKISCQHLKSENIISGGIRLSRALLFLVLLRLLVASVLPLCSFSATVHLIDRRPGEVSMTSDID